MKYAKLADDLFTDGCGCYNSDGKCFCAECYHYGQDAVNCSYAGDSGPVYVWDGKSNKFVMDMRFVNCTPHAITLNDGTVFPPSGNVARVSSSFTDFDCFGVCGVVYGELTGVPDPEPGVLYIVSSMVLAACNRPDLVAPATGHPNCVRENGFIKSVPGFVR